MKLRPLLKVINLYPYQLCEYFFLISYLFIYKSIELNNNNLCNIHVFIKMRHLFDVFPFYV